VTTSLKAQLPLLAEGLATLHSLSITHRDLDPRNVLVFHDGAHGVTLKIADFGHSTIFNTSTQDPLPTDPMDIFRSNDTYSAPECLQPQFLHNTRNLRSLMAIDVWALGCMYLELIVFIHAGPSGIKRFRAEREGPTFVAGIGVQSDIFHNGATLKPKIWSWLEDGPGFWSLFPNSAQKKHIFYYTLLEMFDEEPLRRPLAADVAGLLKSDAPTTVPVGTKTGPPSGLTEKAFSGAAARIFRKPQVAPKNRRVHWKCVFTALNTLIMTQANTC
jgi:serine/threonine protein kinase